MTSALRAELDEYRSAMMLLAGMIAAGDGEEVDETETLRLLEAAQALVVGRVERLSRRMIDIEGLLDRVALALETAAGMMERDGLYVVQRGSFRDLAVSLRAVARGEDEAAQEPSGEAQT